MTTTRVFQNGNSQAVRIPREFQLSATDVEIFQRGEELIIRPHQRDLSHALDILAAMPDDFMADWKTG